MSVFENMLVYTAWAGHEPGAPGCAFVETLELAQLYHQSQQAGRAPCRCSTRERLELARALAERPRRPPSLTRWRLAGPGRGADRLSTTCTAKASRSVDRRIVHTTGGGSAHHRHTAFSRNLIEGDPQRVMSTTSTCYIESVRRYRRSWTPRRMLLRRLPGPLRDRPRAREGETSPHRRQRAGKSTFLKTITGLLRAAPASVGLDGRPIGGLPVAEIVRARSLAGAGGTAAVSPASAWRKTC